MINNTDYQLYKKIKYNSISKKYKKTSPVIKKHFNHSILLVENQMKFQLANLSKSNKVIKPTLFFQ